MPVTSVITLSDGTKTKQIKEKERVPVMVQASPGLIAKHCKISLALAKRYIKAMVACGLVKRAPKAKVKQPHGAPLVIGGFNVYREQGDNEGYGPVHQRPIYFWSPTHKGRIRPVLERFNVYSD